MWKQWQLSREVTTGNIQGQMVLPVTKCVLLLKVMRKTYLSALNLSSCVFTKAAVLELC